MQWRCVIKQFLIASLALALPLFSPSINAAPDTTEKKAPLPKGPITPPKTTHKTVTNHCDRVKHYNKKNKRDYYTITCKKPITFDEQLEAFLQTLTPDQQSALEKRLRSEQQIASSRAGLSFYEPTYFLPFYYTGNPYQALYRGNTPENQPLKNEEFKGQLSFQFPIWYDIFNSKFSFNVSYTQLSYWQFYAKSQFFRETDYEPQLFVSDHFTENGLFSFGVNHESNGRGGSLERSWNRAFLDFAYSGEHWLIDVKPWIVIFPKNSSSLHNPDITHYLGYGRIVIALKYARQEISFTVQNAVESGFKRGALEVDYAFPIHGILYGYLQFFSGYGQSLAEYNHYTNSAGVGIAISNWI